MISTKWGIKMEEEMMYIIKTNLYLFGSENHARTINKITGRMAPRINRG
jgi:hypothetical protein